LVSARSAHGERLSRKFEARLGGWEEFSALLLLPSGKPGYWEVEAKAADQQGRIVARATSGLAVVRRPPNYGRPDPKSFFGLQSQIFNFEAAERIGCKTIRVGLAWRWTDPRKGLFYWEETDRAVSKARKHGMKVLLTLLATPPDWAAWRLWESRPLKRKVEDDRPAPKHLSDWREFVKACVSRYLGRIEAVEIENEPDLTCWIHPRKCPSKRAWTTISSCYDLGSRGPRRPILRSSLQGLMFQGATSEGASSSRGPCWRGRRAFLTSSPVTRMPPLDTSGGGKSPNGPRRAGSTRSVKRSSNYWRNSESPEGCG
ncbi:MAG TPA: hypothetical protein EYP65_03155, partial [Armatimonadetes bacterium]|nr:hypothetical protein [Armatimonadota bacterium]